MCEGSVLMLQVRSIGRGGKIQIFKRTTTNFAHKTEMYLYIVCKCKKVSLSLRAGQTGRRSFSGRVLQEEAGRLPRPADAAPSVRRREEGVRRDGAWLGAPPRARGGDPLPAGGAGGKEEVLQVRAAQGLVRPNKIPRRENFRATGKESIF